MDCVEESHRVKAPEREREQVAALNLMARPPNEVR